MASGRPNPAWASQIPMKVPFRSRSGKTMRRPDGRAVGEQTEEGISVIWMGTTIRPTTTMNSTYRPLNSIHEKA
jgi:hypothetical protein